MRPEDIHDRLTGLGFDEPEARILTDHFLDAEARGKRGHGLSRVEWLSTLPDLDPSARPKRLVHERTYERWDGNGSLGYLTLAAIVEAQLAEPPAEARLVVAQRCFPTGVSWIARWSRGPSASSHSRSATRARAARSRFGR